VGPAKPYLFPTFPLSPFPPRNRIASAAPRWTLPSSRARRSPMAPRSVSTPPAPPPTSPVALLMSPPPHISLHDPLPRVTPADASPRPLQPSPHQSRPRRRPPPVPLPALLLNLDASTTAAESTHRGADLASGISKPSRGRLPLPGSRRGTTVRSPRASSHHGCFKAGARLLQGFESTTELLPVSAEATCGQR
jgi:hypothetical protein